MTRLYHLIALVAMAGWSVGCASVHSNGSLVLLPADLQASMRTAPVVECECSTPLDSYIRTKTFELGGRVEWQAQSKDQPLVFHEIERTYPGSLGSMCSAVTIEVASGYAGNPLWRGQDRACYTPGLGADWEGGHWRAVIKALNNLHQPGQPAPAEVELKKREEEKKKKGGPSQVF